MLAPAYSLIEPPWFEDPNFIKKPDDYSTTQSYAGAKTSVYMFTRKLAKDLEGLCVVLLSGAKTNKSQKISFANNTFNKMVILTATIHQ